MKSLVMDQLLPFGLSTPSRHPTPPLNTISLIRRGKAPKVSAQVDDPQAKTTPKQQLNLSVLRFTFGIPWLDESYLPRWIGYGFGSLILLNHFVGSNSPVTSAQLISEALGLSLAAFSATLPYLGKFLKGAAPVDQTTLPEGAEQIFVMSHNISDNLTEDLAWATYVLLRNTNSLSVLIYIQGVLCVRGYWNTPDSVSRDHTFDWFRGQVKKFGLSDMKERDTLYFPQRADSGLKELLPKGTISVLIQPVVQGSQSMNNEKEKAAGFILLASSLPYAFSEQDRSWIGAIANKFRSKTL
ncbi:Protein COFACTOR ASSEMBLY OF COMPLEX C SUBUNIT B ccb2, chloroplastic [Ancistrocladus abbreviatus]